MLQTSELGTSPEEFSGPKQQEKKQKKRQARRRWQLDQTLSGLS